jgi:UDP-2,3-diacylglucosamine pyrophosphatase LpxH
MRRYRTLFLSDLHLGGRGCQADLLLDFLAHTEADAIYLVGDIIDGWRLEKGGGWPRRHREVVRRLLRKARDGARVIYLPGNHDAFARDHVGRRRAGVEILGRATHVAADGRRFLVIHGDQFDIVVRHAPGLALLGDWLHDIALRCDAWRRGGRPLDPPGWSLSAWAKRKVKDIVSFMGNFESTLAAEARRTGCDGVICGHIHHAVIKDVRGVVYVNAGDFVSSCTAVVEHFDGRLEIVSGRRRQ